MDIAKGLPEELRELTGYHCLNSTKELKKFSALADPDTVADEVEKVVDSFISDLDKFKKCFWERPATDMRYGSAEALFLAQPSGFASEIIDDYFSGKDEDDAKAEGEEFTSTLESMVESVISCSLDVAMCRTHNLWDRDDSPNNLVFEFKGAPLEDGLKKTYGDTKAELNERQSNHFGV